MSEPRAATVVVIGAGVIGCSIAFALTRRGLSVATVEGNDLPFSGMSASAFGSLTPFSDPYFAGVAAEYADRGVRLYRNDWLAALGCTHADVSFTDYGLIQLTRGDAQYPVPNRSRVLTISEIRELEPNLGEGFDGGILHDEPWFDSGAYYEILSAYLKRQSNHAFYCGQRVVAVTRSNARFAIELADRTCIEAEHLVMATGLTPHTVVGLPLLPLTWIRGDAISVQHPNLSNLLTRHVYYSPGFITPRANGTLLLGATYDEENQRELRRKFGNRNRISVKSASELIAANMDIFPALSEYEVASTFRGWRPASPDKMPILGVLSEPHPIVVANGFIGLGVTMAPAVAEDVATYIADGEVRFPQEFDPHRFNN